MKVAIVMFLGIQMLMAIKGSVLLCNVALFMSVGSTLDLDCC